MGRFHPNTDLDPRAEALALVRRIEAEATDEDMVIGMCNDAGLALKWRAELARAKAIEASTKYITDRRADLIKAKRKGVEHIVPPPDVSEARVQLGGPVIPDIAKLGVRP